MRHFVQLKRFIWGKINWILDLCSETESELAFWLTTFWLKCYQLELKNSSTSYFQKFHYFRIFYFLFKPVYKAPNCSLCSFSYRTLWDSANSLPTLKANFHFSQFSLKAIKDMHCFFSKFTANNTFTEYYAAKSINF